jgi:hypothetical protein
LGACRPPLSFREAGGGKMNLNMTAVPKDPIRW